MGKRVAEIEFYGFPTLVIWINGMYVLVALILKLKLTNLRFFV